MKIDYIDGYHVDSTEYGVGLTSPDDTRHYGVWIPLNYFCNVPIDIKPGSDPNAVNLGANGVVPVAILGSATFDVTWVDPNTVTLGSSGVAVKGKGNLLASVEDVNNDGFDDLVCKVETENLVLGDVQGGMLTLTGELYPEFGGTPIFGTDDVYLVPPE